MKKSVTKNKMVSMTYELKICDNDGELIDKILEEKPFSFLYGNGILLDEFEAQIRGLKVGEDFEFSIDSTNAYGIYNNEMISELPSNVFKDEEGNLYNDFLKVGSMVPMRDYEGNFLNGKVIEIKDKSVIVDFNHPLASEDLFFKGKIIYIRDANAEEIRRISIS